MRTTDACQYAIQVSYNDLVMFGILTPGLGYHGNRICCGKWKAVQRFRKGEDATF